MQLYALDKDNQLVSANQAEKQTNYFCLECFGQVRVRGGILRRDHFYHLVPNNTCSLEGKSLEHLQVQCYLHELFPEGTCQLERRFPEIGRIADVVWESEKIVFEVQCSPIYAQEVKERIEDYTSMGYTVVWILHDRTFNKPRASAVEDFLQLFPHYFTNMDASGIGEVYDQFSILQKGFRRSILEPLSVNLLSLYRKADFLPAIKSLPLEISRRLKYWSLCFDGDLLSLVLKKGPNSMIYLEKTFEQEALLHPNESFVKNWLYWTLVRPYKLIFQMLLEKACR